MWHLHMCGGGLIVECWLHFALVVEPLEARWTTSHVDYLFIYLASSICGHSPWLESLWRSGFDFVIFDYLLLELMLSLRGLVSGNFIIWRVV